MREHNPGSVAHNGAARDGYRIEKHLGGAAAALIVAADQPAAAVDVGNAERFRMQRSKARNEVRSDLIRVVQPDHAIPHPDAVGLIAAHACADERQIFGRARTDTLHLAQLIGRRLKDGMERAEMLHQSMGNRVGVPLPDGIIQQNLQQLMVRERIDTEPAEFIKHAPAMPLMWISFHGYRLPCRGSVHV